jgi:hypothetical protein
MYSVCRIVVSTAIEPAPAEPLFQYYESMDESSPKLADSSSKTCASKSGNTWDRSIFSQMTINIFGGGALPSTENCTAG